MAALTADRKAVHVGRHLESSLEDLAHDAEVAFLATDFKKALTLCNEGLVSVRQEQRQETATTTTTTTIESEELCISNSNVVLRHSLSLTFIENKSTVRQIEIHFDRMEVSPVDRLAAVALQCWFEIANRTMRSNSPSSIVSGRSLFSSRNNPLCSGRQHLLPFLEAYSSCSAISRPLLPMSLDLAVILILFLHALGRTDEAIQLACRILHRMASIAEGAQSYLIALPHIQSCFRELFIHLLTKFLPYAKYPSDVVYILKSFLRIHSEDDQQEASELFDPGRIVGRVSDLDKPPHSDAILTILSFLATVGPDRWIWQVDIHRLSTRSLNNMVNNNNNESLVPTDELVEQCKTTLGNILSSLPDNRSSSDYGDAIEATATLSGGGQLTATARNNEMGMTESNTRSLRSSAGSTDRLGDFLKRLFQSITSGPQLRRWAAKLQRHLVEKYNFHSNPAGIIALITLAIFAWRKRRAVMKSALTTAILSPFKEIVDAFLPS